MKKYYAFYDHKRIKKLQRELSRKRKGSNNYNKCKQKLAKAYEKLVNVRTDVRNRVVSFLSNYGTICIQDDNIKAWHRCFGKKVQATGLGGITSKLETSLVTLKPVDQFQPTTKTCSECGCVKEHMSLSERTYQCEHCGFTLDRDWNSAINMITFNNISLPADHRKVTPVERTASAQVLELSLYICVSYLEEAGSHTLAGMDHSNWSGYEPFKLVMRVQAPLATPSL